MRFLYRKKSLAKTRSVPYHKKIRMNLNNLYDFKTGMTNFKELKLIYTTIIIHNRGILKRGWDNLKLDVKASSFYKEKNFF
ncbi:hypothetical protein RyT2_01160 [Pseudolactococcus yaeyamensis]